MPQVIQRNFTGGELAPAMRSRTDLAKYTNGVRFAENMFIRAQGGLYSRPGTKFIGEIYDSSAKARLIPFSFNTEQTYVLVFENLKMRVIKDGGFVLETAGTITGATAANPVEITDVAHGHSTGDDVYIASVGGMTELNGKTYRITSTGANTYTLDGVDGSAYTAYTSGGTAARVFTLTTTYVTADLPRLSYVQTADVMTICHPGYVPRELSRTGHSSWTLTDVDFSPTVTTPTGLALSTAGGGGGANNKTYRYKVAAVVDGVESLPCAEVSHNISSHTTTYGSRLDWNSVTDVEYYRIYKDPNGNSGSFGWIGDSKDPNFIDFNTAPVVSDAPLEDNQPFTGADNQPATVGFYQQRKMFANTNENPQTLWATQTAIYDSLRKSRPSRDDDSLEFTIAARQINEIRHIIPVNGLVLGTAGGIWRVTEGQDEVLTPDTVGVKIQSYRGMSYVAPIIVGDSIIFVQEKGSRVRDTGYEFTDDKFKGNDISLMSEHLFEGYTIDDMTYAEEPYSIVWMIRSDGTLLSLTYQKEHEVWGWTHHVTDGVFESVTSITEDGRDAVYVIVKRTIDGSTVRYVERLEARNWATAVDAFCVDCGLTYDGVAADNISGLDHLEGKTVAVLADGVVIDNLVVSGGAITLPREYSVVHVGLPFTTVVELLDIDQGAPVNPDKIRSQSVSKVVIETENSRGGWVGPRLEDGSTGEMREIKPRTLSDGYDAIELRSTKEEIYIEPTWSRGGGIRIEQRSPLPLTILSVTPQVDIGG